MSIFFDEIANSAASIPFVGGMMNKFATNKLCNSTTPRPRAYSLWSSSPVIKDHDFGPILEYTTWPMITDTKFTGRHLPPIAEDFVRNLPFDAPIIDQKPGDITKLFLRDGDMKADRSSALFMFFAQWFTDSVLRTDSSDRRKNTSNHNIDLCQIYGLDEETSKILRSGIGGRLRSQIINGEEYLDYLGEGDGDGWKVKGDYEKLNYISKVDGIMKDWGDRKSKLYATGLERGNSSIGYVAVSTLFMREHNRICEELSKRNPDWDDERLFQTARMINIVILMKLVIVDYINHIAGTKIFKFDVSFSEKQDWYRPPWIALEFNLLYRWHGLIPDNLKIDGKEYDNKQFRFNNKLLEEVGLNKIITAASNNPAGEIPIGNVPEFMLEAEYRMIKMGRDFRLAPYNQYRKHFGLKPFNSFDDLTSNKKLSASLKKLYKDINNVDLVVGLFAERRSGNQLYGDLMYTMVGYDALTQIYTNPLLSKNIYNQDTFTQYGLELIDKTNSVQDLADRNNTNNNEFLAKFNHSYKG